VLRVRGGLIGLLLRGARADAMLACSVLARCKSVNAC
jgi:hypothetical protein